VHYCLPPKSKEDKPCRNLKPVFLATLEPFETPCRCCVRIDIHVWIHSFLLSYFWFCWHWKLTEICEVYDHTHCCCHNFGFAGI
jgi:hypothetical protein